MPIRNSRDLRQGLNNSARRCLHGIRCSLAESSPVDWLLGQNTFFVADFAYNRVADLTFDRVARD